MNRIMNNYYERSVLSTLSPLNIPLVVHFKCSIYNGIVIKTDEKLNPASISRSKMEKQKNWKRTGAGWSAGL